MSTICIGADVGGTSIKLGIFSLDGSMIKKWEIKTRREDNCKAVIGDIAASIREELEKAGYRLRDCVGIGMGVPGPVMPNGYVEVCVNLGWRDRYPARELSDILEGIPVRIGNDANIAALGETWQGGAKGFRDVVMVTLGTGVGGGIIIDNKIVEGRHGLAGEIGHIHIREGEKEFCNCGGRGCLEQVASATGIAREAKRLLTSRPSEESRMRKHGEHLSAKNVLDAAKAGDKLAGEVMDTVADFLGLALSYLTLTIDPDVFVIGGGVSKAGSFLSEKIEEAHAKYLAISKKHPKIVLATLGNDAGIYGGARLVL
ncbi:MAG: ROK family glucokinase [Johnsonella sp.]|nr:ROK family glucokinase [Johnsonella sp.]